MKLSPDAASWVSTGSSASSESMVASLDARITLTPTELRSSSDSSIATRSSR